MTLTPTASRPRDAPGVVDDDAGSQFPDGRTSSRPWLTPTRGASLLVYLVLAFFGFLEKFGETTNDTKTPLVEQPSTWLHQAFVIWSPISNFGELQNQAYGYLFPQGPYYLVAQLAHVPPWVSERLWSLLIIVIAAEGARLVGRSVGLGPWPAWLAGIAFGIGPRILGQVAIRSAELVPEAVTPWMVLPIIFAIQGRLSPRRAALFSAAAFLFSGAVNATATIGGLPLAAALIIWAVRRKLVPRAMFAWWCGLIAAVSVWWASALMVLRVYSPPFFDYVEDARATTATTGYASALRGTANWVGYTFVGDQTNWPPAAEFAFNPWLVGLGGLVAALGVVGMVRLPRPWRTPFVVSACLGLVSMTIAHLSWFESPLAPPIINQLDGLFALLRNVSKGDPMLRLPLCLGLGVVLQRVLDVRLPRRLPRAVPVALLAAVVLSSAQPAVAMNLRTPGWTTIPAYWHQTADFLAEAPGNQRSWIVPGTGFAFQTWGWTNDEPMSAVAKTPWVSRSQVPLAPPQTIRALSGIENYLETGTGSPDLAPTLARLGLGYVVVRNDLQQGAAETTTNQLVSIALARSPGVKRVATFGQLDFGPAIEIYRVGAPAAPTIEVRPESSAVTVAGTSADVVAAVGAGLIGADQPAVVQGDSGWDKPADIVGDTFRKRARNFGRVHDGEGPMLSASEPSHSERRVRDYPANTASEPLLAKYSGIDYATASSSQAYPDSFGPIMPEAAPYSAVDGDGTTAWRSSAYFRAKGQWMEVHYDGTKTLNRVVVRAPVGGSSDEVRKWRISAGGKSQVISVDRDTGVATGDLGGVRSDRLRVTAEQVVRKVGYVSIVEVEAAGLPAGRTLVEPAAKEASDVSFTFSARPDTRACITTLLGPGCDLDRRRPSEETAGIDRTIDVDHAGSWTFQGTAVARARPGTLNLLVPQGSPVTITASSTLGSEPALSPRSAYDGTGTTSWMAEPGESAPVLTVDFAKPRTVDRIGVAPPASPAVAPTNARIVTDVGTRDVRLGDFGQFEPLTAKHFEITLTNPTRQSAPIGVGDLLLGEKPIDVPLVGQTETGSVCGLGPTLHVDGKTYKTQVSGLLGDVVSAGPLTFASCSGPVTMDQGTHRVWFESTEQFQPVSARLDGSTTATPASDASRSVRITQDDDTHQEVRVGGGVASVLSTTRNFNAGWVATLDGKVLPPLRVDGWAQGWRLPAGDAGLVKIDYAPQHPYLAFLIAGLVLAGLVLLVAIAVLVRTRLTPGRPVPGESDRPPRSVRRRRVLALMAVPASWLLGGLPALAGLVLGAGLSQIWRRPRLVLTVALALLLASTLVAAVQMAQERRIRVDLADFLAGTGFVLALVSMRRPHPGPEPEPEPDA